MNLLSSRPRLFKRFSRLSLELLMLATAALASSDTSLHKVQAAGLLKVCVPFDHPPLSGKVAAKPGLEVELAQAVAKQMGLGLQLDHVRGWELASLDQKVRRTQCQLIAGGVVDAEFHRQQLEFLSPSLDIGWAIVYSPEVPGLKGTRVTVYAGFPGLDRLALSRFLKGQGSEVVLVGSAKEFSQSLTSKQVQVGITDSLLARHIAAQHNFKVAWVPMVQPRYALKLLGVWKGERALKKEVMKAIGVLEQKGQIQALFTRYKLATISERCGIC